MAAVIALALIVENRFIVFPFCGIVLIRGILVRQGVAIGTKVGQVAGVGRSAALTGAVCRPGLLLAGGLIVVHILAPSVAQSRMLFCIVKHIIYRNNRIKFRYFFSVCKQNLS